jgi:hypothetical protein
MSELTYALELLMEDDARAGRPFRAALLRQRLSPEGDPSPGFFQKAAELGVDIPEPVAFVQDQRHRLYRQP